MVGISIGCINENTYGISCVHCGKCGRKFTYNGIDDSRVVHKETIEYSGYLVHEQSEKIIETKENLNEGVDC